jgi:hypothetical protein
MKPKIYLNDPELLDIIAGKPAPPPPPDLSKFAVLVPCRDGIPVEIDHNLRRLEAMGVPVIRMSGVSEIGLARSRLLTYAMAEGRDAVLFIDSDIIFDPADAIRILRRPEPVVAGVYSQRRWGKLNVDFIDDGQTAVRMGKGAGDRIVRYVGAGFLRITREACDRVIRHHDLPLCTAGPGSDPVVPFFLQTVVFDGAAQEFRYLGEDYAWCERAGQAGIDIIADMSIRLFHVGSYHFGWEEAAGMKTERIESISIE